MPVTDSLMEISSEAELRGLLSHAQIVKSVQPCAESLEELERYYGPQYATRIYG